MLGTRLDTCPTVNTLMISDFAYIKQTSTYTSITARTLILINAYPEESYGIKERIESP